MKPAVTDTAELARAAEAGESDPWLVLSSYLEPFFEFTGSRERISLRGGTIGRAMTSSTRSMRAQRKAPVYRVLCGLWRRAAAKPFMRKAAFMLG